MHKMIKVVKAFYARLLAFFFILMGCLSCIGERVMSWDKDYYSYKCGAMIDGVECHEQVKGSILLPKILVTAHLKDSSVFIDGDIYLVRYPDNRTNDNIYCELHIFADTSFLSVGEPIFLNNMEDSETMIRDKFFKPEEYGEIELPIAHGAFFNGRYLVDDIGWYNLMNGQVYCENGFVFFDFDAVDAEGNIVQVKKGFCRITRVAD